MPLSVRRASDKRASEKSLREDFLKRAPSVLAPRMTSANFLSSLSSSCNRETTQSSDDRDNNSERAADIINEGRKKALGKWKLSRPDHQDRIVHGRFTWFRGCRRVVVARGKMRLAPRPSSVGPRSSVVTEFAEERSRGSFARVRTDPRLGLPHAAGRHESC